MLQHCGAAAVPRVDEQVKLVRTEPREALVFKVEVEDLLAGDSRRTGLEGRRVGIEQPRFTGAARPDHRVGLPGQGG